MEKSLFGEIVLKLGSGPEDIATEALLHILSEHSEAWPALRDYLSLSGIQLQNALTFQSQSTGDDQSTPDLVGFASDGSAPFVAEMKFWAGLTENQPVSYLKRLPEGQPGLLLIVVPSLRLASVWGEVVARCSATNLLLGTKTDYATDYWGITVNENHKVAIVSWRALLGVLRQEAETRGLWTLRSDVEQLAGLCERMDGEAFLPLTANDLAPSIGQRAQQFTELVHEVVGELETSHGATTKGLSTGGWQSTYGKYFVWKDLGCFFCYSPSLWAVSFESPMWLTVKRAPSGQAWIPDESVRHALAGYCSSQPTRFKDLRGRPTVAIQLPIAVEKPQVIESAARQILAVLRACPIAEE